MAEPSHSLRLSKLEAMQSEVIDWKLKKKTNLWFGGAGTVYELVCNKAHLTAEGLAEIRKIKKEINLITSVTGKTGDKLAKKKMKI